MISEFLEELGLDREQLRKTRRQILEGIVLLCQWQLQRMNAQAPPSRPSHRGRKIPVE